MKKRFVLLFVLVVLLVGCSPEKKNSALEQQEGIIADVLENPDGWNQILVIPNIEAADLVNKEQEALIEMAQEQKGAYYGFKSGEYENLIVGTEVIVYWDGSQLDSNPPQRGMEKVEVRAK